jgi:opacity protein-like surface antigen
LGRGGGGFSGFAVPATLRASSLHFLAKEDDVRRLLLALGIVPLLITATQAAGSGRTGDEGSGIRGWGPRVGLSSDPDQLVVGVHMDAGRLAPRVRFQPAVELGVGDHVTILSFKAPVHYRFPVSGDIHPYAGGGVSMGFVSFDEPFDHHDNDVNFAIDIIGGLEWQLRSGNLFSLEVDLMAGDLADFELMAGWTFR